MLRSKFIFFIFSGDSWNFVYCDDFSDEIGKFYLFFIFGLCSWATDSTNLAFIESVSVTLKLISFWFLFWFDVNLAGLVCANRLFYWWRSSLLPSMLFMVRIRLVDLLWFFWPCKALIVWSNVSPVWGTEDVRADDTGWSSWNSWVTFYIFLRSC
jgi:hypothetical protein